MKKWLENMLVVEDDDDLRFLLEEHLGARVEKLRTCGDLAAGRRALREARPDLLLMDVNLPDGNGLEFLEEHREALRGIPVVVMTAQTELSVAIAAIRAGARDFLTKPLDFRLLDRTLEAQAPGASRRADNEVRRGIIGDSPAMRQVWEQVDLFAPVDITMLLLGESGTGKELFARAIHEQSKRSQGPFIELDCASLPSTLIEAELFGHEKGAFTDAREARKGKFELAQGGTLFLDELGNLSLDVQAKLLRVLQSRQLRRLGGSRSIDVDVRVIAATNADLQGAIDRREFRNDLYYRIAEMTLPLPPLRERLEDVPALAEHFIQTYNRRFQKEVRGIQADALRRLKSHTWPGNVRELENVVRAALVRARDQVLLEDLMPSLPTGTPVPPPRPAPGAGTSTRTPAIEAAGTDRLVIEIPWGSPDAGLDLKKLHHDVRQQLDLHILEELVHRRKLKKSQIARYLKLDYKVLLEKMKALGIVSADARESGPED